MVIAGLHSNSVDAGVSFQYANALAIDESGNVFVADMRARKIFKVQPSGDVETYAGNGKDGYSLEDQVATSSAIGAPCSLAYSPKLGLIIGAIGNSPTVRRVKHDGTLSVLAGNGLTNEAPPQSGVALGVPLLNPYDVICLSDGTVAFSQYEINRIVRISDNLISDYITADDAKAPTAFALGPDGSLYFVERHSRRVSVVKGGMRKTVLNESQLNGLDTLANTEALAVTPSGHLLIASKARIVLIRDTQAPIVIAGRGGFILNGPSNDELVSTITDIELAPNGDLYVLEDMQLNLVPKTLLDGHL